MISRRGDRSAHGMGTPDARQRRWHSAAPVQHGARRMTRLAAPQATQQSGSPPSFKRSRGDCASSAARRLCVHQAGLAVRVRNGRPGIAPAAVMVSATAQLMQVLRLTWPALATCCTPMPPAGPRRHTQPPTPIPPHPLHNRLEKEAQAPPQPRTPGARPTAASPAFGTLLPLEHWPTQAGMQAKWSRPARINDQSLSSSSSSSTECVSKAGSDDCAPRMTTLP